MAEAENYRHWYTILNKYDENETVYPKMVPIGSLRYNSGRIV